MYSVSGINTQFEPSRGCLYDCLDDLCEIIRKVCDAVASAFQYLLSCTCLDDDYTEPYAPNPIYSAPVSFNTPSIRKYDIPLVPNQLPGADFKEVEPTSCPFAALPTMPDVKIGTKLEAQVLQEIRDAIRSHRSKESVAILIGDHRDLLTQDHWIQLLGEIEPSTGELVASSLSDFTFDEVLKRIPEVAQKRLLAEYAAHWVDLKKRDAAYHDPSHPFAEIFESFDSFGASSGDKRLDEIQFKPTQLLQAFNNKEMRGSTFATPATHQEKVLEFLAIQELSRFAPLLRAFSEEKKSIKVKMAGYEEKSFDVNYLRDSVFKMAGKITGFFFYHVSGNLPLKRKDSKAYGQFYCGELNADKVTRILDLAWNAYSLAKANDDLQNFYETLDTNGCFDWRSSSLWNYMQKFSSHPDFTLKPNQFKEQGYDRKIAELYRVFMNEQYAVFAERQEPKLKYEDFKKKMEQRGADAASDLEIVEFFKSYATMNRFEDWIRQKESQEILLRGFSDNLRYGQQSVRNLMAKYYLEFSI